MPAFFGGKDTRHIRCEKGTDVIIIIFNMCIDPHWKEYCYLLELHTVSSQDKIALLVIFYQEVLWIGYVMKLDALYSFGEYD